jgi:glutathione S-transferase
MIPLLYSFRRCPYAIRTRMVITYCDFSVEIREVDLKNKPAELLKISPKGTVPVLQLARETFNGKVIDQSRDIIKYVLAETQNKNLLPESVAEGEKLIDENDQYFKIYLDKYKYPQKFPEETAINYRGKAEVFLKKLEAILSQNKFLSGDKLSYIDIAIFPFIRQFAMVDKNWFDNSQYKNLKNWLDFFLNSEIFLAAMEKSA